MIILFYTLINLGANNMQTRLTNYVVKHNDPKVENDQTIENFDPTSNQLLSITTGTIRNLDFSRFFENLNKETQKTKTYQDTGPNEIGPNSNKQEKYITGDNFIDISIPVSHFIKKPKVACRKNQSYAAQTLKSIKKLKNLKNQRKVRNEYNPVSNLKVVSKTNIYQKGISYKNLIWEQKLKTDASKLASNISIMLPLIKKKHQNYRGKHKKL